MLKYNYHNILKHIQELYINDNVNDNKEDYIKKFINDNISSFMNENTNSNEIVFDIDPKCIL